MLFTDILTLKVELKQRSKYFVLFFSGRLANEVTDIFLSRSVVETGNKEEKDS